MNVVKNSILNFNVVLNKFTTYLFIGYFKIWFCKCVYFENHQILCKDEDTACIEFGEDMDKFLEALKNVFDSRYIDNKIFNLTETISRGNLKINVNASAKRTK